LKRFDFDHHLQRMSAVVHDEASNEVLLVCKGSSEAVASVCDPTTLPKDLSEATKDYARNGCYVLGSS
jgi:magnesium-transporting ATPase (P-type)